ncbi:MAG: hypothetical protein FJ265_19740 [Planctomycetes bacterium]|nr:hypothetical protein [Planctomycetota bacterium]
MDPIARALRAIDAAEDQVGAEPRAAVDADHARRIGLLEVLPENQDGADKSWVWPVYEFCRRHFTLMAPR